MTAPFADGTGHEFDGVSREVAVPQLTALLGPDMTEAVEAARELMCPLCGSGPWRSLSLHTAKRHDLPVRWLMDVLDIPVAETLVADDLRQRFAEQGVERGSSHMAMMRDASDPSGGVRGVGSGGVVPDVSPGLARG